MGELVLKNHSIQMEISTLQAQIFAFIKQTHKTKSCKASTLLFAAIKLCLSLSLHSGCELDFDFDSAASARIVNIEHEFYILHNEQQSECIWFWTEFTEVRRVGEDSESRLL
jgi:hypothetical protein